MARPMTYRTRIRRRRVVGVLVVVAAIVAIVADRGPSSSSTTSSTRASSSSGTASSAPSSVPSSAPSAAAPSGERRSGPLGEADGKIPDGTTIFDDDVPGVAKLDPAFRDVLRRAATDARADGVTFVVDSGWRSKAYQAHLLQDAIEQYGSLAEASRWVASPDTSEHVKGEAIDLGRDASSWLGEHGAAYGLCRVYANESWHFERRPDAAANGCPALYADPTQDPRMRR